MLLFLRDDDDDDDDVCFHETSLKKMDALKLS